MKEVRLGRQKQQVEWTWADRLVAFLNPRAGMERLRARTMLALTGGYNGGARDRRQTRNWRPKQTSANEDLSYDLPHLRARSRDLARNVPIATGAISTVVTNVVGDGLVLQSQIDRDVLGLTEEDADAWQRQAEREFAIWAKSPDFTGRLNWDEMQALVLRAVMESGDTLVARRRRLGKRDTYGLKLQVIESDRLSNPDNGANKPDLVDGVEMDADGVPIAYHISTHYPDDTTQGIKREWRRFDIGSTVTGQPLILHLYEQKRPGQARGIPYLAPVIEAIKQLGDYAEAEARAAVINAMFTVFIEHDVLPDDGDASAIGDAASESNTDPNSEVQLGSGAIVDLASGEKATFADPKRPNTAFDAFVTAICRHIGVALELPYEMLLKSFTASYSASRAALEMAWQFFRARRTWLAWKFCQPAYEWVITEAVATGRLSAPGFFTDPIIREAWLGSEWIGPANISIDPQAEANADETDLRMGVKTRAQIIMERTGGDWLRKHEQLVKEETRRREDGLNSAVSPDQNALSNGEDPATAGIIDMNNFGIAVRSGFITPQVDDEPVVRTTLGLPAMSKPARDLWKSQGDVRQPITLQTDQPAPTPGAQPPAPPDEGNDDNVAPPD